MIENPLRRRVRQSERDCFLFAAMSLRYDSSRISVFLLDAVVKSSAIKSAPFMRIMPKLQAPAAEHLASGPPLTIVDLVMFPALESTGEDDIG